MMVKASRTSNTAQDSRIARGGVRQQTRRSIVQRGVQVRVISTGSVADASGLDMGSSRRLQLAAESGGVLGLLVRPPWEVKELSA